MAVDGSVPAGSFSSRGSSGRRFLPVVFVAVVALLVVAGVFRFRSRQPADPAERTSGAADSVVANPTPSTSSALAVEDPINIGLAAVGEWFVTDGVARDRLDSHPRIIRFGPESVRFSEECSTPTFSAEWDGNEITIGQPIELVGCHNNLTFLETDFLVAARGIAPAQTLTVEPADQGWIVSSADQEWTFTIEPSSERFGSSTGLTLHENWLWVANRRPIEGLDQPDRSLRTTDIDRVDGAFETLSFETFGEGDQVLTVSSDFCASSYGIEWDDNGFNVLGPTRTPKSFPSLCRPPKMGLAVADISAGDFISVEERSGWVLLRSERGWTLELELLDLGRDSQ